MDDRETSIISAAGLGLVAIGIYAWWKSRKDDEQPNNSGSSTQPSGKPYTLNNDYEYNDDGLIITSYTNGSARGWQNHNPLNIVISSANDWVGKFRNNTDGRFEQFIANIYGYRAAIKTLQSYIRKGYNTIRKISDRWSGVSNNTNYANYVSTNSAIGIDDVIAADDYTSLMSLVYAMAMIESGATPKPDEAEIADAAIMVYNGD